MKSMNTRKMSTWGAIALLLVATSPRVDAAVPYYGLNATSLQNIPISAVAPTDGQVLTYTAATNSWGPGTGGGGGGAVSSVFTRTGGVVAASGDYTCAQVTNCPTTSSAVQTLIGNGVYVPVGGYYAGTATGLVNVLAASLPASIGTPTQAQLIGVPIWLTANLANTTTTPTLNINSLGAITIVKGSATALTAADYGTIAPLQVIYNGTNYILQNPLTQTSQTGSAGNWQAGTTGIGTMVASTFSSASSGTSLTLAVPAGSSASALGSAVVAGASNTSTGAAGNAVLRSGQNSGGGQQGFAQVLQSFTTASALAATFEAVSMTSTADQVGASAAGSVVNVGIAQSVGGTGTAIFVASHGKTTARFENTPVIGDVACYPTITAGLLHDNGATTACTLGEAAGVVTGQVSGLTATVLLK